MSARQEPDHWTLRARREGYPARSVFKLQELDRRLRLIRSGQAVLDVGASPGSWTLYVLRRYPQTPLVALDLCPLTIPARKDLTFYQLDIFSPEAAEAVGRHGPYGTILSDAAPATTGNSLVDTGRSEALVEQVLLWARLHLRPGGNLLAKVFQGSGQGRLVETARELFERVRVLRPEAVRSESREAYLVGLGRRAR